MEAELKPSSLTLTSLTRSSQDNTSGPLEGRQPILGPCSHKPKGAQWPCTHTRGKMRDCARSCARRAGSLWVPRVLMVAGGHALSTTDRAAPRKGTKRLAGGGNLEALFCGRSNAVI